MQKWAMVIDLDKCTGCGACVVGCQTENNIPLPTPQSFEQGRSIRWMSLLPYFTDAEFPHVNFRVLPRPCMQCDNPPCVKVCPVRATYKSEETGIVGQIFARCIGCRYCTTACPYTVRYFNWFEPKWPDEMKNCLDKDVSIRPKGVVEKCTFCHHRLVRAREKAKAEGRDLLPNDYLPACVEVCPANAMYFGDLENPKSIVSEFSRSRRAFKLMDDLGTEPKVIYLSEQK